MTHASPDWGFFYLFLFFKIPSVVGTKAWYFLVPDIVIAESKRFFSMYPFVPISSFSK